MKLKRQVIGMLGITVILIAIACGGIYINFVTPHKTDIAAYADGDDVVTSKIEYAGYLNQKTELVSLEQSDRSTKMDMIEGNGDITDIVEIAGYAYIEKEDVALFKTKVILEDESGNTMELRTSSDPQTTMTDQTGGEYNYNYAYFRSVIPTDRLEQGERYRVYILFPNMETSYLKDTGTEILMNAEQQVEVHHEEE